MHMAHYRIETLPHQENVFSENLVFVREVIISSDHESDGLQFMGCNRV